MKVLVCHNRYQRPGGEDVVFEAETALLEAAGHTVIRHERSNHDIEALGRLDLARRTVSNPQEARAVGAIVARERPDVVHFHNTFPLVSPGALRAARREGAAVVQTLHNFRLVCPSADLLRDGRLCEDCIGRTFAWPALRHACYRDSVAASATIAASTAWHHLRGTWSAAVDRYVVPTRIVRDKFVQGGFPADRIDVKPNFVARDPGIGCGEKGHAVFVGRLSPEKGLDVLLEAWRDVPGDTGLVIVGDGPSAPLVQEAARRDPRIEWVGHRSRDEVERIVGAASLLVMPSVWYETFGLCIVEAFARGTPVVASRLGAMAELVEDGQTGALFDPGDAPDLARTVIDLQRNPTRLQRMRGAARAAYEARFSAPANLSMLLAIYERAIRRHQEGSRIMLNETESASF